MIIDNRRTSPVYLIEPKDRGTVQSKRNVLNSFFNARVFVMHVYRMLPAVTPVTGALKRVCETGANSDGDDRATKKTRYAMAGRRYLHRPRTPAVHRDPPRPVNGAHGQSPGP